MVSSETFFFQQGTVSVEWNTKLVQRNFYPPRLTLLTETSQYFRNIWPPDPDIWICLPDKGKIRPKCWICKSTMTLESSPHLAWEVSWFCFGRKSKHAVPRPLILISCIRWKFAELCGLCEYRNVYCLISEKMLSFVNPKTYDNKRSIFNSCFPFLKYWLRDWAHMEKFIRETVLGKWNIKVSKKDLWRQISQ